ncbi:SAG-related sequence SRS36A [Toxoplasma gondii MAS]|uniref:SAG-related sequence SRS36A n=2 Tax=Toxoplasma gondii TaxID=5811 RepID=A0A086PZK3_TOXGO|nr:SAG-related sequence SRS36A [Toxoplasma gondii MAS]PUA90401.1 SAG-related sequence SRS36A [Toxoplasma gondii TgCATBr9]
MQGRKADDHVHVRRSFWCSRGSGRENNCTLSQSSNGITVDCSTHSFTVVPCDTSKICIGEGHDETLTACNTNEVSTIKEFLGVADGTNAPQWTSDHALTIPTEQFSIIDKTFFAECLSKSGTNQGTKECLVPVSVKARASAVKNGVLICAYGTESNNTVSAVTLDAKNNSLTIICDTEGQMHPEKDSLTAYHCTNSNTENCKTLNLSSCRASPRGGGRRLTQTVMRSNS